MMETGSVGVVGVGPTSTTSSVMTATSSAASTGGGGGGLGSTSLYLFTFLITLILLLVISGAVVFRSYFLRRQLRRRVEEAIASGALMPDGQLPPEWGGSRRDFGEKPVMSQVSLGDLQAPQNNLEKWQDLRPVSATIYRPNTISPRPQGRKRLRFGHAAGLARFFRSHIVVVDDVPSVDDYGQDTESLQQPNPDLTATLHSPSQGGTSDDRNNSLLVSMMIVMPNAHRPVYVPSTLRPTSDEKPMSADAEPSSTLTSLKGKAVPNSQRSSSVIEEDLPDIQLGVIERSWSKEAEAMVCAPKGQVAPSSDDDKGSAS
ncbi:hypothetical protein FRB94_008568 [Tulasnella sp. JGI-2019a]|nr:hypothetical protein FRB94_008568 [Tulasnella sp. JGI-2019a]